MSINIEYTNKEINELIITNVLKMLERRGLINSWNESIKKLSNEDKLCFAVLNRYFALIEHENAINIAIHKDDIENVGNITENKNNFLLHGNMSQQLLVL